ncbi:hypothetical protein [Alkalimonas amylolytica]|uniref:Uncharacterized protein n=1 Tax=Alkalimonas amylolytica TaxID=152573 RepID=A0A1H4F1M0_ALKAM|nr:hypothetical protein [Alkalimonas amylolytica]SEA91109.1 hypothetical protein SAMN04488051_108149 [Alkalimonas amylolytica]
MNSCVHTVRKKDWWNSSQPLDVNNVIDQRSGEVTDSLLLDGLYERVQLPGGVIEHKFRVGNARVIRRSNNTETAHYRHADRLGSSVAVTSPAKNMFSNSCSTIPGFGDIWCKPRV